VNKLEIHPSAENELRVAAQFYEARLAGLGEAFLVEVGRSFDRAHHSPESGAPCYGRYRRLMIRRFPYSVVYEVLADAILILAVAHHRRKPGYWLRRA
jgi:plasmid stabilization system protein ParE